MIKPKCSLCHNELNKPGGLLFSPPNKNNMSKKDHLCKSCYVIVKSLIKNSNKFLFLNKLI